MHVSILCKKTFQNESSSSRASQFKVEYQCWTDLPHIFMSTMCPCRWQSDFLFLYLVIKNCGTFDVSQISCILYIVLLFVCSPRFVQIVVCTYLQHSFVSILWNSYSNPVSEERQLSRNCSLPSMTCSHTCLQFGTIRLCNATDNESRFACKTALVVFLF